MFALISGKNIPPYNRLMGRGLAWEALDRVIVPTGEPLSSGLDNNLERARFCGSGESLVSVEDSFKFEAMSYQQLRIDLLRSNAIEQHWRAYRVDQSCGDGDVAIPQVLQMKIHLCSMHPDIGDGAARRDDSLAQFKSSRNADRLDSGVDTAIFGHLQDRLQGLAIGTVDDCRCTEPLCHLKSVVVEIDHDDIGRRVELGGKQRR